MINRPGKLPEIASILDEEPPPSSVEQEITPMERSFRLLPERPVLLQEGQRGYAVLGQLYARVKLFEGQFLSRGIQPSGNPRSRRRHPLLSRVHDARPPVRRTSDGRRAPQGI
jgi:hypothetical protein